MRYLAILLTAVVLAAGRQTAPLDSVVQFLVTSAATDFHTHPGANPARFRNVRVGHTTVSGGAKSYRLCGEFLPKGDGAQAQWTRFATVKTSGYEQWLGGPAASYCQGASFTWDKVDDLSSELQRRLDAMK